MGNTLCKIGWSSPTSGISQVLLNSRSKRLASGRVSSMGWRKAMWNSCSSMRTTRHTNPQSLPAPSSKSLMTIHILPLLLDLVLLTLQVHQGRNHHSFLRFFNTEQTRTLSNHPSTLYCTVIQDRASFRVGQQGQLVQVLHCVEPCTLQQNSSVHVLNYGAESYVFS